MVRFIQLGMRPYNEVLALQTKLREERIRGLIRDTVIFCEHPAVFTTGKRDCSDDWLSSAERISADGIEVVRTDRGGRVTYHGPGQLVGYLIFDIKKMGLFVKEFVSKVEGSCMDALKRLGIDASRDKEHPGLWVGGEKIVAIGLNVSQGVSMHGFALNVYPVMGHYRHIVPCGIRGRGVTSMQRLLGYTPAMDDVVSALKISIARTFGPYLDSSTATNVRSDSSEKTFSTSAFLDSSGSELKNSS